MLCSEDFNLNDQPFVRLGTTGVVVAAEAGGRHIWWEGLKGLYFVVHQPESLCFELSFYMLKNIFVMSC